MNKFEVGSIIKATSGRESGEMFVISQINLNEVLLVNGKTRKLEKPKRKNIKHIYLLLKETELKELFENNAITFITEAEREELKKLCKEYEFIHYEQISAAKWEEYRCNMYELSKEQDELCEKNKRLEKEVLQEMRDVIHVNKS